MLGNTRFFGTVSLILLPFPFLVLSSIYQISQFREKREWRERRRTEEEGDGSVPKISWRAHRHDPTHDPNHPIPESPDHVFLDTTLNTLRTITLLILL